MLEGYKRFCDCCGVQLNNNNNKCGFELCDKCNEKLEENIKKGDK